MIIGNLVSQSLKLLYTFILTHLLMWQCLENTSVVSEITLVYSRYRSLHDIGSSEWVYEGTISDTALVCLATKAHSEVKRILLLSMSIPLKLSLSFFYMTSLKISWVVNLDEALLSYSVIKRNKIPQHSCNIPTYSMFTCSSKTNETITRSFSDETHYLVIVI